MIAVPALPGAPRYEGDDKRIIDQVLEDLEIYKNVKVDSIVLENDHDVPYGKPPLPQKAVDLMLEISKEVRKRFDGPIGIQLLEGANEQSPEVAGKTDLEFIRVEAYVFAHIGNSGIFEGCGATLQRKKAEWGFNNVKIFTDVKKKHCSHALTADLDITDEVKQAEFSMVDGVIVTSKFTGEEPDTADLEKVRKVTKLPVLIGSGMNKDNISTFLPLADGFIVGTTFRKNNDFFERMDPQKLKEFTEEFNRLRKKN